MKIRERVIEHQQKETDFSRRFNTNLSQAIKVIRNDDTRDLKCLNITGKLYGIDHIEFTKNSGSTWSHRTSLTYTLSALEEENRRIAELISDFKQDLKDLKDLKNFKDTEEFEIIQSSINELCETVSNLHTLFLCVRVGYRKEEKRKQHGDKITELDLPLASLLQNLYEVNALRNQVK